jgi:hypothetical protein
VPEHNPSWRLFTLDEANALLPRLSRLLDQIQDKYRALKGEVADGEPGETLEQRIRARADDPVIRELLHTINEIICEVESYGCHFKGAELGLVDFPSVLNSEVVYLCWQHGEPEIAWWHGVDENFSGRRPIDPGPEDHAPRCHLN